MAVDLKKKPVSRTEDWQVEKDAEHFFVSSVMYWNVGTDLLDVLSRQAKLDKSAGVKRCVVTRCRCRCLRITISTTTPRRSKARCC
jgi:hypothetical protein